MGGLLAKLLYHRGGCLVDGNTAIEVCALKGGSHWSNLRHEVAASCAVRQGPTVYSISFLRYCEHFKIISYIITGLQGVSMIHCAAGGIRGKLDSIIRDRDMVPIPWKEYLDDQYQEVHAR